MKHLILTLCTLFLSISLSQAQENKAEKSETANQEKINIMLKDDAKPDIYVDGVKFEFSWGLIDQNKIKSVSVLKGDKALKEYNAKDGVIFIVTKKDIAKTDMSWVTVKDSDSEASKALIIVDGLKTTPEMLKKLNPDNIKNIKVIKDETALKDYNAPNGVIIITTKKGKKN